MCCRGVEEPHSQDRNINGRAQLHFYRCCWFGGSGERGGDVHVTNSQLTNALFRECQVLVSRVEICVTEMYQYFSPDQDFACAVSRSEFDFPLTSPHTLYFYLTLFIVLLDTTYIEVIGMFYLLGGNPIFANTNLPPPLHTK